MKRAAPWLGWILFFAQVRIKIEIDDDRRSITEIDFRDQRLRPIVARAHQRCAGARPGRQEPKAQHRERDSKGGGHQSARMKLDDSAHHRIHFKNSTATWL